MPYLDLTGELVQPRPVAAAQRFEILRYQPRLRPAPSHGPAAGSCNGKVFETALAIRVPTETQECRLDVDRNRTVDMATDIVYIARHLLGLSPVPPSFRAADPFIVPDATTAATIDALCP